MIVLPTTFKWDGTKARLVFVQPQKQSAHCSTNVDGGEAPVASRTPPQASHKSQNSTAMPDNFQMSGVYIDDHILAVEED